MDVAEEHDGCDTYITGINFWSYAQYDECGNEVGSKIDLTVSRGENGVE